MRKIFRLAVTLLKSGGGLVSGKSKRARWVLPVVLVFAFASFGFSLMYIAFALYDGLASVGIQDIMIPLSMGATSAVIFMFGIFYVISVMYHAEDVEMLMYLPLRPAHILGAKFITLVVYEYIFEAFILIPLLLAYGIKSAVGAPFIIYSVFLFLLLPAIALSIAAVLVMIVMRFTSFGKNKQAFKFVGGILAMVLAIGFNLLIQSSVQKLSDPAFLASLQDAQGLVQVLSNIFPGVVFASNALIQSSALDGLLNFALFALCSAGAVAIFIIFGQLLYLKGVAGITESAAKRKGVRDISKETQGGSAVSTYIRKEIRLLVRSPIAFMNCVLTAFIWPILLLVVFFSRGNNVSQITSMIAGIDNATMIAIISGVSALLSSMNAITSTAISREGKSLYFTKYIPMSMRRQLLAKTATGMIFSVLSIVLLLIVVVVLGVNIADALIGLSLGIVISASCSYVGIIIDAANPKLDWVNEQQAIKQNLNVILHMLAGVLLGAVAIVPVVMLPMSAVVAVVYIAAVFGILLAVLVSRVNNFAAAKIESMDV